MELKEYHFYGSKRSFLFRGMMKNTWALLLLLLVVASSCEKDFDTYYERPSWLEGSAYDVLQAKGKYTNYLKLMDKTLYAKTLKGSGSYTFFAPNDAAFEAFFAQSEYKSVDDIPVDMATEMVSFTMIYNQYESANLGNVWGSVNNSPAWEIGASLRKQTPSYKSLYEEQVDGVTRWVYDDLLSIFSATWHNYRYLPILTNDYFASQGLAQADYQQVFAGSQWSDKGNVLQAAIIEPDIATENGMVHGIDKVITPLKNMDEMIMEDAEDPTKSAEGWKRFKELLYHKLTDGSYQFINYVENTDALEHYKKIKPEANLTSVHYKMYNGAQLPFPFNAEGFVTSTSSSFTSENTAFTFFMPSDRALKEYTENKLQKYTNDYNNLSQSVLSTFITAHMVTGLVWPSNYKMAKNTLGEDGEFINGEGIRGTGFEEAKVTRSQFASNGIVYNIDRVIEAGPFESVYGRVLLDPEYSIVNDNIGFSSSVVYQELMKTKFSGYAEENFTILLPSNTSLTADGFEYDEEARAYVNSLSLGPITASTRLHRLISSGIIPRHADYPLDLTQPSPLGNAYDGYGFAVSYYGDLIRYRNGKVQAVGNIMDGVEVEVEKDPTEYVNGQVYTMKGLLNYSPRDTQSGMDAGWNDRTLVTFIEEYMENTPNVSMFKEYWALAKTEVEPNINAAGFYTVLIPTNERIQEAIDAKHLPTVDEVTANKNGELMKTAEFILAHLLSGEVYPDDGLERVFPGNYESYKTATSHKVNVGTVLISAKTYSFVEKVKGEGNILRFRPDNILVGKDTAVYGHKSATGTQTVIRGLNVSNVMGPRSVIHQFDGYICFEINSDFTGK